MNPRKILITGINGQVGHELVRSLQGLGEIIGVDRSKMDLTKPDQIRSVVRQVKPSLIVNPAAYTAVDKAESEQALAHQINAVAPGILAEEASTLKIPLIHYSTDYVYSGTKAAPYVEEDSTDPQNVYGRSKLAGEEAIASAGCPYIILRTSWVYGGRGANFLKTMLRLGAERNGLRVVSDQYGAPTWSRTIAELSAHIIAGANIVSGTDDGADRWWSEKTGIYHLTAAGEASWASFAETIFALRGIACTIDPIPATDYPTPARRPQNSRVSNAKLHKAFGLVPPDWHHALALCIESM